MTKADEILTTALRNAQDDNWYVVHSLRMLRKKLVLVGRCLHYGRHDRTRIRFLDYARNDDWYGVHSLRMLRKKLVLVGRSLDVARDDSGAVNSPSTTVGMILLELRMTVNIEYFI